jgi:hypothetical protein
MNFDAYNCPMKIQESIKTPTPKVREYGVHSFTLSYTPRSMKCDSWASFLAFTFVSRCFGHEPKARVVTSFEFLLAT